MKFKKLISIALMIAMLMTVLPTVLVSAEETTFTWSVDDNGVLTVEGTGEIYVNRYEYNQPWYSVRDTISKIVVDEGITSLGEQCFRGIQYVSEVSLPDSLETIKTYAFGDCTHLEEVTLPQGLKEIGEYAFYRTAISEVTVPSQVMSIGNSAFAECTFLEKAAFECKLTTLPSYLLGRCNSLKEITFPIGVSNIGASCFIECESLVSVELPSTVTALDNYAFEGCTALTEINTENVLTYGYAVFKDCESLETVEINKTVSEISSNMFENSGITSIELPANMQEIKNSAFSGCKKLAEITLPEKLTSMGDHAFGGCVLLETVTIPKYITVLDVGVFRDCTSLAEVNLHDNVTRIDGSAFLNCGSLTNITLPENLDYMSGLVFAGTGITELIIPDSLKTCGTGWDTGYGGNAMGPLGGSDIVTVSFEGDRTVIPDYMFDGAAKLKNLDLSNIEKIGSYAFNGCSSYVPVLADTTTEIGDCAFMGCTAMTSVYIPKKIATIPYGCFQGTGLRYVLFPDTVKAIGGEAYKDCKSLSYIQFSDSISDIGDYAFRSCTALGDVEIPGTVKNIGSYAFLDCTNLAKLTMHKGTETIGIGAFKNCALTAARPSQTVRSFDDSVFANNPLTLIVAPRFCKEYTAKGNSFSITGKTYISSTAQSAELEYYCYDRTIMGVAGTVAETEAINKAHRGVTFEAVTTPLTTLEFDKDYINIALDETYASTGIVTVLPEMDGSHITFESANEEVATVDVSGYVHGEGYGTTTITMTSDNGLSDTLIVNVVRPHSGLSLSTGYTLTSVGSIVELTSETITEGSGSYIWTSSDESVATVIPAGPVGLVTAKKSGTVVISVADAETGEIAFCVVAVASDGTSSPDAIGIENFVVGCDIALNDAEKGGNVIAALYSEDDKLLDVATYEAADKVRAEFTVSTAQDLTNAKIKVFWWNEQLVKPVSKYRLINIE